MQDFVIQIISGVIVAVLVAWFGIGKIRTSKVVVNNFKLKKTGKWLIIIAVALIIWSIVLFSKLEQPDNFFDLTEDKAAYSLSLFVVGITLLGIGKIVAWFQKS